MKFKIVATVILGFFGLLIVTYALYSFLDPKKEDSGLLVEANTESWVYINNVNTGVTPLDIIRSTSEIIVRIVPKEEGFDNYEVKVKLVSGVRTIIKKDFNKDEEKSSVAVVSFEKINEKDAYLAVVSVPNSASVYVDGRVYGFAPIRIKLKAGEHKLVISNKEYQDKVIPINAYPGYLLTASIKLAKSDVEPTPTPIPVFLKKIVVLDTDLGYLRVREGPGISNAEAGRVETGDILEVLEIDENGDWYRIDQGWVSSEFTEDYTADTPL